MQQIISYFLTAPHPKKKKKNTSSAEIMIKKRIALTLDGLIHQRQCCLLQSAAVAGGSGVVGPALSASAHSQALKRYR